jgi:hypothetical protein
MVLVHMALACQNFVFLREEGDLNNQHTVLEASDVELSYQRITTCEVLNSQEYSG